MHYSLYIVDLLRNKGHNFIIRDLSLLLQDIHARSEIRKGTSYLYASVPMEPWFASHHITILNAHNLRAEMRNRNIISKQFITTRL